jgi:hypothetical protein
VTILLIVGVGLVLFGALVLLRFPDRPGGRIAWHGFEVSSLGAGLPIIALGVLAIGFAGARGTGDEGATVGGTGGLTTVAQETTAVSDAAECFSSVPEEELQPIEEGTRDFDIFRIDQPKSDPVWLAFTVDGEPIGGLLFRYIPANSLFKIQRVVDAGCNPVDPVENVSRGGDPRTLQNWDTVQLRFDSALYNLRLGDDGTALEVNYFVRVPE